MSETLPSPTVGDKPVHRPRPPGMTMDKMVAKYVQIRDEIAGIEKAQTLALKPYRVALDTVGAWLLEALNASGEEAARTLAGTAYKSVRTSAVVEDWAALLTFIRDHEAWELLERRVSKLAVERVMEDTRESVPGVRTAREIVVNVRRS